MEGDRSFHPEFDVDMGIVAVSYLVTAPGSTTSEVAKAVFDPDETDDLRNADRKVRYYFEEKYPHLVERNDDGSPQTYSVDDDRVFFGGGRVEMQTLDDREVSMGLGATLVYFDGDDNPVISVLGRFTDEDGDLVFEFPADYESVS